MISNKFDQIDPTSPQGGGGFSGFDFFFVFEISLFHVISPIHVTKQMIPNARKLIYHFSVGGFAVVRTTLMF